MGVVSDARGWLAVSNEYRYVQTYSLALIARVRFFDRSRAVRVTPPMRMSGKFVTSVQCTQKERTTLISQWSMRCLASEEKVAELWGQS